MTSRFLNFLPLVCALLFAACGPASRTDAHLNDIESYVDEAPDSARTALQVLDTTALRTRRLRARYALLRTAAQAKCYDDITIPGLLDDASWFARHGSPDEKMKLWYYCGRIQDELGNINEAAIYYTRAEALVNSVRDQHAVGLLYFALRRVYQVVNNKSKELEYAEKAIALFRRIDDPMTGPFLGLLAMSYHNQQKWAEADSLYREAMPFFEVVPSFAPGYLYDYAEVKLFQPDPDPAGAKDLLERYWELTNVFGINESGAYAYALELLGDRKTAEAYIAPLRSASGPDRYGALIWLERIDVARNDYANAYWERAELYRQETSIIQATLEDSVMQALREDAARQAAEDRMNLRLALILAGGLFFAMLSVVLLLLLRKGKIKTERDRLVDLREEMQEELEKVQAENVEKTQLISGQEDRIREMEDLVAREREAFARERVNRLRQLGELRSTFWWRERGGMREADAIQRIKKEFSYVFQTDDDGASLIRNLDEVLNGAVSRLRDGLRLGRKPKEVLFLCCCILDLEPEMIAEIMDTTKANIYEKRSRLRARVRALNDPLLAVLVGKNPSAGAA